VSGSEYLFTCANSSEPEWSTAFAERHLAVPLRDDKGMTVVIVDMNLGPVGVVGSVVDSTVDSIERSGDSEHEHKHSPADYEIRQIGHLMKLLTAANDEVVANTQDGRQVSCVGERCFDHHSYQDKNTHGGPSGMMSHG